MIELLPCPFCGGEASKRLFYKGKYRVHCNVCDAHSGDVCDTEAEAIAAWNTRAAVEFDNWFYLPKPKEPIVEVTETTHAWDGTKVRTDVFYQVQEQAVVNWARELDEHIIKRVCEVWNSRAERTCKFVSSKGSDYPPVCSACGYELGIYDCEWFEDGTYGYDGNYCPKCGARVVGRDEE